MIEGEPVGDTAAAIVSGDHEALESELPHHGDDIGCHRPLGVRRMVGQRGRATAVAVAAQVGADDREPLGEPRRNVPPHQMRLRKAVQQHQRRAGPESPRENLRARGGYVECLGGCEGI